MIQLPLFHVYHQTSWLHRGRNPLSHRSRYRSSHGQDCQPCQQVVTTCFILVTFFISMLTALPSARLLGASSHFRTWSQLASWEPVSETACFCLPSATGWEGGLYLPAVGTRDQEGGTECGKSPTPTQDGPLSSTCRLALSCPASG